MNRLDTRLAPSLRGNDTHETLDQSGEKQGTFPGVPTTSYPGAKRQLPPRPLEKPLWWFSNTESLAISGASRLALQ